MMNYSPHTAMASALALILSAGAATADVTPAEVWADWQDYLSGFGFAVTADEAPSSGALALTNIVLTQTLPDDAGTTTVTVPGITLEDNGDGTVEIIYPDEMPIIMTGVGENPFVMEMLYRASDLKSTVSGDPSQMLTEYTAKSVGVTVGSLSSEGETVEFDEMSFDVADVVGSTNTMLEGGRTADQSIRTGPATYTVAFVDPDPDTEGKASSMKLAGRIESLAMTGQLAMPDGADMNDMSAALNAGLSINGDYVFGPGSSVFDIKDEDGTATSGTSASSGGNLAIKMDESGLTYGGATNDVSVETILPQLPFPVAMGIKKMAFGLTMPLTKDEEPQDFGLNLTLADFTLSDAIWAMFDPTGKLPRDPANLALDLAGKASVLVDIMDTAQMAKIEDGDAEPVQLNALTLNSLLLSLAGAELTGQGDVAFDNDDTTVYEGMPTPVGDVAFKLTGANTLIETLVDMGLIGPEQMMMARMGLGAFAVPGEGDDVLTSKIEFTEDGGVLANGNRLK